MSDRVIWDCIPREIDSVIVPIYGDAFVDTRGIVRDVCGFTGSSGVMVLTRTQGWLWTDSRYSVQASKEVDAQAFLVVDAAPKDAFASGARVALDYRCVTQHTKELWATRVEACGGCLGHASIARAVLPQKEGVCPHPFYDVSFADNLKRLRVFLQECSRAQGIVCSGEEMLSWLMNVRCPKRHFVPACALRALFVSQDAVVVCAEQSLVPELKQHVPKEVSVVSGCSLSEVADGFDVSLWLCDKRAMTAFDAQELSPSRIVWGSQPCGLWKACKGERVLQCARQAHRYEGAALVEFLTRVKPGMSESESVQMLESVRRASPHYWGPSFPTISAFGAHSAIVHYHPTECSSVIKDGPWLLDAGGQYSFGTTDMTRTLFFGEPPQDFRQAYTRVLQAHIALASAKFPEGAHGYQLDALARSVLWRYGWDYGHSTGHGVGASLNVHEAPPSLGAHSSSPVHAGMVVSIEPGFYQEDMWGVRLENLYYVCEDDGWCFFKPLTVVPFDTALVDLQCLSVQEKAWLNAYHAFVREELSGALSDNKVRSALAVMTQDL